MADDRIDEGREAPADQELRVETDVIKDLDASDGSAEAVRGGGDPQGTQDATT